MPIYGLNKFDDNENFAGEYPVLGHLRKGGPKGLTKQGIGPNLNDHFRFEGDYRAKHVFCRAYGEKPNYIKIYLPYPATAQLDELGRNFDSWLTQASGGKLTIKCDGRRIVLKRADAKSPLLPCDLPCPGAAQGGCGQCKPNSKLFVFIPELAQFGPQVVVVHSTSKHDAARLARQLLQIRELFGTMVGIPLILFRSQETVPNPVSSERKLEWLLNVMVDSQGNQERLQAIFPIMAFGETTPLPILPPVSTEKPATFQPPPIIDEPPPALAAKAMPEKQVIEAMVAEPVPQQESLMEDIDPPPLFFGLL